jgi:sporulation protein YlmC with PRC-barrel domain
MTMVGSSYTNHRRPFRKDVRERLLRGGRHVKGQFMTRILTISTALLLGSIALPMQGALAQTTGQQDRTPMAEECMRDLNEVARRMQEDQFWLTGWGGPYGAPAPQSTLPPATSAPATTAQPTGPGADPRGVATGIDSPRHQIRALYSAARVLAHQGEQEGCAYVLGQLSNTYDGHVHRLQEAGIDPSAVSTWRQERIALAQPLTDTEDMASYRIDDLTGTDVRNLQDEHLGSISDVLIDPNGGAASYVLLARGGFMGMGEDYIAIPWDQLRATPGLETIVIDRTNAELDEAPTVEPERFRDPTTSMEDRERTDVFWTRRG